MVNCPACAGPDQARATCATCEGAMEVSQATYDAFVDLRDKRERFYAFVFEAENVLRDSIDSEIFLTVGETTLTYTP